MRLGVWFAGVVVFGVSLGLGACASEEGAEVADPVDDAGGGQDTGTSRRDSGTDPIDEDGEAPPPEDGSAPDAGPGGSAPTVKTLVPGAAVLVALTDADALYLDDKRGLFAIPIAGGASQKIVDLGASDELSVSGGAAAVYTGVANGVGTLNVWTRASGYKTSVATSSVVGLFAGTSDGTRIAYSKGATPANAAPTATPIVIADTTAPSTAVVSLTGANALNVAAAGGMGATCPPDIGFVGKRLLAAYCTGTLETEDRGKLFTVDGATLTRVDTASGGGGGSIQPAWYADATGTKIFVRGLTSGTPTNEGRWIDAVGRKVTDIEGSISNGFMQDDGKASVYVTSAGALKTATTATPPVITTVTATGVRSITARTRDGKKVLYRTLAPSGQLVDVRYVDLSASTPTAVDVVPTAAAIPVGFNGEGSRLLYLSDVVGGGAKLNAKPTTGGASVALSSGIMGVEMAESGAAVAVVTSAANVTVGGSQVRMYEFKWIDTVAGGTPQPIAKDIPRGSYAFAGKTFVFTRLVPGGAGSGIYAITLP